MRKLPHKQELWAWHFPAGSVVTWSELLQGGNLLHWNALPGQHNIKWVPGQFFWQGDVGYTSHLVPTGLQIWGQYHIHSMTHDITMSPLVLCLFIPTDVISMAGAVFVYTHWGPCCGVPALCHDSPWAIYGKRLQDLQRCASKMVLDQNHMKICHSKWSLITIK